MFNVISDAFLINVSTMLILMNPPIEQYFNIYFYHPTEFQYKESYLKLMKRSVMVQDLTVSNTQLRLVSKDNRIDHNRRITYIITIMNALCVENQSQIEGEFGIFTENLQIEQATVIHGDISIHDDTFTARENSKIIAKRM